MTWQDDSWKDSYDAWKLASPDEYDDRENSCDHEDYDVDIVTGRASCNNCLANWYVGDDEIQRQIEHEAAYYENMERECRRQWWRDLWASIRSVFPPRKRLAAIDEDDVPF